MKTAVFTIASKNYFAFVKTLLCSLEKSNSGYDRFVAVADEITDVILAEAKNFQLLSIEDMKLPEEEKMLFRYKILELNTAIKPFVFHTLFEKLGYDRVIYFDPDIYVYKRLSFLENQFDKGYEIVLTPHLTDIYDDSNYIPNDLDIMKSGVYNLGFLALSKSLNTMKFIHWWEKKLEFQCVTSFRDGLFVDQKWMDLVPGMFENVYILKNAGYNVAYWNLSHRKIHLDKQDSYLVNGDPLIFFHFSGLNPEDISNVSKYQNRFNINNVGESKLLIEKYAASVLRNGFRQFQLIPYSYNHFESGNYICDLFRMIYRKDIKLQQECGKNPFLSEAVFYKNRLRIIANMLEIIWYERKDVRMTYPKINSEDYICWFLNIANQEYKVPLDFAENICVKDILRKESILRVRVSGKYRLKLLVKSYSSEKAWECYKKCLKRFGKK